MTDSIGTGSGPSEGLRSLSLLTDGLVVAGVSSISYALAFAYECGLAAVFHYPTALITIDWNMILFVVALLLAIGSLLYIAIDWLGAPLWAKLTPEWQFLVLIFSFTTFPWAVGFFFMGVSPGWHAVFMAMLFPGALVWPPLITAKKEGGYVKALESHISWFFKGSLSLQLDSKSGGFYGKALLGAWALYAALDVSYGLGYQRARYEQHFFVIPASPPMAVLRFYSTMIIASPFDEKKKVLIPPLTVLRGNQVSRLALQYEKVGPFRIHRNRDTK